MRPAIALFDERAPPLTHAWTLFSTAPRLACELRPCRDSERVRRPLAESPNAPPETMNGTRTFLDAICSTPPNTHQTRLPMAECVDWAKGGTPQSSHLQLIRCPSGGICEKCVYGVTGGLRAVPRPSGEGKMRLNSLDEILMKAPPPATPLNARHGTRVHHALLVLSNKRGSQFCRPRQHSEFVQVVCRVPRGISS